MLNKQNIGLKVTNKRHSSWHISGQVRIVISSSRYCRLLSFHSAAVITTSSVVGKNRLTCTDRHSGTGEISAGITIAKTLTFCQTAVGSPSWMSSVNLLTYQGGTWPFLPNSYQTVFLFFSLASGPLYPSHEKEPSPE